MQRTDVRLHAANDYPSLWVHVDAAWAGVALACPELRQSLYLDDINAFAHSFCTNFHKVRILVDPRTKTYRQSSFAIDKWGLVNFDCSTLWVRDRKKLTDALDITPDILRSKEADAGLSCDLPMTYS